MKYEAVIFDFFGTLVDVFSRREYENMLLQMSSILSVPREEFTQLWYGTAKKRGTGIIRSIEANIEHICRELKVQVHDSQIEEVARVRFNFTVRSMTSNKGGIEVISRLKSEGYRIALISNCSSETPKIWEDLPLARLFDVTVFSCLVGLQKPDPRIYRLAVDHLAVRPESCLYIGDGDGEELLGAASIGMHPVLIRASDEDANDALRTQAVSQKWDGPVIASLKEVLELVKRL